MFPLNTYFWPEVEVGTTASLPCGLGPLIPNGMARRTCNPNTTEWDPVSLDECFTSELSIYLMLQKLSYFSSLIAVAVEWDTSELVVAENSVPTFLCASVVNPDIFNLRVSVQLQAFTQPLTAQGIATVNRSWKHLLYILSL